MSNSDGEFPKHNDIELGDDLDDWAWVEVGLAWIVIGAGCVVFGGLLAVCLLRGCVSQ